MVTFESVSGARLPFVRRLGLDPTTRSAPFVTTRANVTGVVIDFSAAARIFTGAVQ